MLSVMFKSVYEMKLEKTNSVCCVLMVDCKMGKDVHKKNVREKAENLLQSCNVCKSQENKTATTKVSILKGTSFTAMSFILI